MKTKNIFKIAMLAMLTFALNSCVEDNDYSIPTIEITDPGLVANTTIQSLKTLYYDANPGNTNNPVDFSGSNAGLILEGYVVSSDESGNIYKALYIQDKPEDPTAAIQLAVDATDMYSFYEVGRKVFVKLDGLGLNSNNGVLQIGDLDGTAVERIASTDYKTTIVRSPEVATIVPKMIESISDLDDDDISMLVQLKDMQVESRGQTYGNLGNTYNVNRTFKSCADDETIIMRNSGYSTFKAQSIPEGKGTITAILGKYRRDFQLFIRDTEDVNLTGNRCDPLFEDDFSTDNLDKWTIQDVTGTQGWDTVRFGNPGPSAKISGFQSGAQDNEDWLISKAIDLSAVSGTVNFSFESVKRYGGPDIEVYYSTNYNGGNPNDAANTWTQLSPTLDTNTGSWSSWTGSGDLDVSSAAGGNLFVAFKYVSTTAGAATFEIDNVKVVAL